MAAIGLRVVVMHLQVRRRPSKAHRDRAPLQLGEQSHLSIKGLGKIDSAFTLVGASPTRLSHRCHQLLIEVRPRHARMADSFASMAINS